MQLRNEIKQKIRQKMMKKAEIVRKKEQINLSLLDEVLPQNDPLRVLGVRKKLARDTALVLADLAPGYNWAHPCIIYLFDAHSGEFYDQVSASFPPMQIKRHLALVEHFHRPVKLPEDTIPKASNINTVPPLNVLTKHPGKRYALLFSGDSDNRHLNDLEFLYRTLIDVYDFDPENILVANHDGTVNYDGAPQPIGPWPGDNTPYRIVVNEAGTRAGFKKALQSIADRIEAADLLLIHTNNHGGGPGDGVTNFCLCSQDNVNDWTPYYVNDFISDLSILPYFEVLMVMMEQCRSGGFIEPIIDKGFAKWTHVVTAVAASDYSLGGRYFDPFARDWIAALAGQNPDGNGLLQVVDSNNDGRFSSAEIFAYANDIHVSGDTPQSVSSPAGIDEFIFFGLPEHDLFLRDNLTDHGREPLVGGGISVSPDIIIFNQELLDPDAFLLSPQAQNNGCLGENVEAGQDNFIYLRVQNRGTQPTAGIANIYWSLPSVLPTPASWHKVGQVAIPAVPPHEMIVVGPLKWKKEDIPAQGHYCFVGLIDSGNDPAPDKDSIKTLSQFRAFIRESNNATWKNFNVVDMFKNSMTKFDFHIQGWPRIHIKTDLVIDLTELPPDLTVKLRILKRLSENAGKQYLKVVRQTKMYHELLVDCGKQACLKNISLKPSDDVQADLVIEIPENISDGTYKVSISQVVEGEEMGRITRLLAVGKHPFIGNSSSRELHIPDCYWTDKISPKHRRAYKSLERALKHGYNGCHYCLNDYSTD